jgi:transcription antitermination factor NusG
MLKVGDKVLILKGMYRGKIGTVTQIEENPRSSIFHSRRKYTVIVYVGWDSIVGKPIYDRCTLRDIRRVEQ